jgi:hypothetical protein
VRAWTSVRALLCVPIMWAEACKPQKQGHIGVQSVGSRNGDLRIQAPEGKSDNKFMSVPQRRNLCGVFAAILCWAAPLLITWLLTCCDLLAQNAGSSNASMLTEARLKAPGWWPTKGDRSRDDYVGAAHAPSVMLPRRRFFNAQLWPRAATRAVDADSLRENPHLTFQIGSYRYQIDNSAGSNVLKISARGSSLSTNLLWAFGTGRIGQTYVYEKNDHYYESHPTFYTAPQTLDVTPGHPHTEPPSLEEGAGRHISVEETRRCFGCHTTASTTKNRFEPQTMSLGVTCEACHGEEPTMWPRLDTGWTSLLSHQS